MVSLINYLSLPVLRMKIDVFKVQNEKMVKAEPHKLIVFGKDEKKLLVKLVSPKRIFDKFVYRESSYIYYSYQSFLYSAKIKFFVNFHWIKLPKDESPSSLMVKENPFNLTKWLHIFMRHGLFQKIKISFFHALTMFSKEVWPDSSFIRNREKSILKLLYRFPLSVTPIFSFFIERVNKKIRKFSRGKSGKYSIMWGYIRPEKRKNWIYRWLAKSISSLNEKSQKDKWILFFNILRKTPNALLVTNVLNFINFYVITNLKKTLIKTYKRVK